MKAVSTRAAGLLLVVAVIGCANQGAPASNVGSSTASQNQAKASGPKTLTLGQLAPTSAFTQEVFSNTSGGGPSLAEVYLEGLVTGSNSGDLIPRLATALPSLDTGSIVVLPDGRMRTTWKLRPDVKWHDGVPFTADDVVFSWQVVADPNTIAPGPGTAVKTLVESAEAPDASTAIVTWKSVYIHAIELGALQLWLLPSHLLADSFAGDKRSFFTQPFFTTELVGLGPFRLVDFGGGAQMTFERFDDYFLGRPKLDRVVIQVVSDPNTLLVNMRAGTIDLLADRTLPSTMLLPLSTEWARSGGGQVLSRQDNWWYLWAQMNPEIAQPAEIARDARVRRGLMSAIDRESLREFMFPGVPGTSADTFMLEGDPRGTVVRQPFARYPFEPERALQQLSEAGWRRGPDGRLMNNASEQVHVEIRGDPSNQPEMAAIGANWRQLGIDVAEVQITPLLARDVEYTSHFPAVKTQARGTGDTIWVNFDGRVASTAANRWTGANHGHYSNLELDRLIDRLNTTLDERSQGDLLHQMAEIMATDLPALPMYFRVSFAAVAKGVRALTDDYPGTRGPGSAPGLMSRNAYLWDKD